MSDDRLAEIEESCNQAVGLTGYGGRTDEAEILLQTLEARYTLDVPWLIAEVKRLRTALKEIADGVHPLEMVRVAQAAVASQSHGKP